MASAYKDGQLKKNPLLGTSFGTNPARAEERERFKGLYAEAKKVAGKGREAMKGRLAGRYARFAEAEQRTLGGLRSKYENLQSKAASARSPEEEQHLQKQLSEAQTKYERVENAYNLGGTPIELAQKWRKQRTDNKFLGSTQQAEAIKSFYGEGQATAMAAQQAYEQDIADKVADLQAKGSVLAADMQRRQSALQQRISDYNLFLGVY